MACEAGESSACCSQNSAGQGRQPLQSYVDDQRPRMHAAGVGWRGHRPDRQRAARQLPAAAGAATREGPLRRDQRSRKIKGQRSHFASSHQIRLVSQRTGTIPGHRDRAPRALSAMLCSRRKQPRGKETRQTVLGGEAGLMDQDDGAAYQFQRYILVSRAYTDDSHAAAAEDSAAATDGGGPMPSAEKKAKRQKVRCCTLSTSV